MIERCPVCLSTYKDHEDKIIDQIDYIICEKKILCTICGTCVDYWAYGYWASDSHYPHKFSLKNLTFELKHNWKYYLMICYKIFKYRYMRKIKIRFI